MRAGQAEAESQALAPAFGRVTQAPVRDRQKAILESRYLVPLPGDHNRRAPSL